MKLVERTSRPVSDNKYYIHTSAGGYNKCIKVEGNSVLPNCVGYAGGRAMEAWGLTNYDLPTCNAESWIVNNTKYAEGTVPKTGAIIVWAKGKVGVAADGAGHVAFVEKVNYNSDGSIKSIETSESGYKSSAYWWRKTYKPPYSLSGYTLQGFIYPPVEFEETIPAASSSTSTSTYTVVKGDTLSGIGKKLNVAWKDIASANNIKSPYIIKVGQVLTIPNSSSSSTTKVDTTAYIKINANGGVWCRKGIGFGYAKYKCIPNGTKCELLKKNAGTKNGYSWDKVKYNGVTVYLPNKWNIYM